MNLMPLEGLRKFNPLVFALASQKKKLYHRAVAALENPHSHSNNSSGTVFDTLVSPTLLAHMRRPEGLINEGFGLVIGGAETTARALGICAWYSYSRKDILAKLKEELKQVMPTADSRPTWKELEGLPSLVRILGRGVLHH